MNEITKEMGSYLAELIDSCNESFFSKETMLESMCSMIKNEAHVLLCKRALRYNLTTV